mgnify:CR=1 FL=1
MTTSDTYRPTAEAQQAEIDRLRAALHEIAEEWAGADSLLPPTPMGAYAVILSREWLGLRLMRWPSAPKGDTVAFAGP